MVKSALERIQELETERKRLLAEAKKEALAKAEEAIAELNALGFSYQLTHDKDVGSKGALSEEPCKVCKFRTDPPHDKRKHRWTPGFENRAFTASKLRELELERID